MCSAACMLPRVRICPRLLLGSQGSVKYLPKIALDIDGFLGTKRSPRMVGLLLKLEEHLKKKKTTDQNLVKNNKKFSVELLKYVEHL